LPGSSQPQPQTQTQTQTQQAPAAAKPDTSQPSPAKPDQAKPAPTAASAIEAAREALRNVEAKHSGNTAELAQALHAFVDAEIDAEFVDQSTLDDADREVRVAEAATGAGSKSLVSALDDQAETLIRLSRVALARPLAERAFAIAQKEFPDSSEAASAANELATVCLNLGDYPCGLRVFQIALDTTRKISGNDSPDLMSTLNELGALKARMGDMEGSVAADEEALRIAYRVKPDDPDIAIIENNLGSHYSSLIKMDKALEHLNRSVEILDKYYGLGSPIDMQVRHNLASVYTQAGQFEAAWKGYEFSLQNKAEQVDMQAITHWMYALSLAQGGRPARAVEEGLTSARLSREMFVLQARTLPERQALAFDATRSRGLDIAISEALKHPEMPIADIYQEVIRSRALVADEMARRQKNLNANNDPETARLLKDLDKARADLLAAEHSGAKVTSPADSAEAISARMETIERSLAERSAALRADEEIYQATPGDVRHNLPANSVLISYFVYRRRAVDHVDPENVKTPSYAAFVLHPGSDRIALFDLGEAGSLNELVRKARAAADAEAHSGGLGSARNERSYREAGEALRRRIWDPLKSEIGNASLALVVADGNLNLIPFAGLPEGGGYLVEHGPVIHTLSSERDLAPAEPAHRKQGLLAIGNPTFELAANTTPLSPLRGAAPACEALTKIQFQPLPGTRDEVSDIRSSWRKWNPGEPSQLIVGDEATLSRFLEDAPRSRMLHVATHAFLVDQSCGSGNPLLRSGLVFAGADRDGAQSILTSQQIASLDLSGVDWAVLSACNTGNGELHDGEGVLGLQRAFREAGARSVIMTLWPVDDDAARRFMHKLYAERLGSHATTADAVWISARALLLERRAAGKSTHPWYWAGFVGAGGWE
jgi:CHAT domain-containing protein/tetratricopeptide (TPR) repeat protein